MQSRLSWSETDCGLRVCIPTDSRDCHLLTAQCLRTSQHKGASRGAPVPADTRTSEKKCWPASRKQPTQSTRREKRRIRCRRCAIPAAVPTPGNHLCLLSASSLAHPSTKNHEQSGRALFEESQHDLDSTQLLIARCSERTVPCRNIHLNQHSTPAAFTSETAFLCRDRQNRGYWTTRASPAQISMTFFFDTVVKSS